MPETPTGVVSVGLDLNAGLRRAYGALIGLDICIIGLIVTIGVYAGGWLMVIAGVGFAAHLAVHLWYLPKFRPVIVLQDGLDVSGRFVPFAMLKFVGFKDTTWRLTIEYEYHGAVFNAWVATAGLPRHQLDLSRVQVWLRRRAGLEVEAPVLLGAKSA